MYSLYGDIVIDPFGGTGTTAIAAIAAVVDSIHVMGRALIYFM